MNVLYGIEITETGLITHFTYVSNMLEMIKKLKFDIILDDFGTGFSSLKYLKEFPIDQLKLDKSFADDLLENKKTAIIVKNIINLCKDLNIKVIVEGVETKEQLDFYKEYNVDKIQGFYFSEPLTKDEFIDYVKKVNGVSENEVSFYKFIK